MADQTEELREAVGALARTGTSVYRIPGCEPRDDDRYTDPAGMEDLKDRLDAARVIYWDASEYSKAITFRLDGRVVNVLCVSPDSFAAMEATTALVTRLAEFPRFAAELRDKKQRYMVFRVIYAMLDGRD